MDKNNLKNKLNSIGFSNKNLVVDAACGYGEWSASLAEINNCVVAFDNSVEFTLASKKKYGQIKNINFVAASLLAQPIKNDSVDGIICADSLMFVNPNVTLKSFNRIMKKGAIAYISVNGIGWIFNCIFSRGILKMDISKINMGLRITFDTFIRRVLNQKYKVQNTVYTKNDIKKTAVEEGFRVIYCGLEGTYLNPNETNYKSLFNKRYLGIEQSLEIVLEKV